MNNMNISVEYAMRTLSLMLGTTTAKALENHPFFTCVKIMERAHSDDIDTKWADGAEDFAKHEYIRVQMAWVRSLADGKWPIRNGELVRRSELVRALWDTAEMWNDLNPTLNYRRRSRKNRGTGKAKAWYEIWRKAVLEMYDMVVSLTAQRLMNAMM